jgi:hypothetical protein
MSWLKRVSRRTPLGIPIFRRPEPSTPDSGWEFVETPPLSSWELDVDSLAIGSVGGTTALHTAPPPPEPARPRTPVGPRPWSIHRDVEQVPPADDLAPIELSEEDLFDGDYTEVDEPVLEFEAVPADEWEY